MEHIKAPNTAKENLINSVVFKLLITKAHITHQNIAKIIAIVNRIISNLLYLEYRMDGNIRLEGGESSNAFME